MDIKKLTCIECPRGCSLEVTLENGVATDVKGNFCPRGKKYAESEVVNPVRVLTTSVRTENGNMASVKTNAPIPKALLFVAAEKLKSVVCPVPVKRGDVIYENIVDGVNVIATCDVL